MPTSAMNIDERNARDARDNDVNNYANAACGDMDEDEFASQHTAKLYSEISNDEFSNCQEVFEQEANKLEREYFQSLDKNDATPNKTFGESPVILNCKTMTTLEEAHFHSYNLMPNRPCSANFKCDNFMSAAEIFEALKKEGFRTEHIRCLQRKPLF